MKKYPLGIQTFAKIIQDDLLYIDKTAIIGQLIQQGSVYFLSRPRRFGKSLLISTLESLFSGQKSLFDGLAISQTDYDFATYPVVKMEFSSDEFNSAESLREYIDDAVMDIAQEYGVTLSKKTYNKRFAELVIKLHQKTGKKVVLLIDEYDKPILNNLKKAPLAEIRDVVGAFYSAAKSLDEHLQFVFITGVSKFAKVSVFSGMNSITDISLSQRYGTLCGITQQELELHFSDEINALANQSQMDRSQILAKIKYWYNGYTFEENAISV
ncbi:MAG: AAA family ATPase, partial [Psychrosphaera sp.]|nr:AAA family ATPase [Psychrosphaera sp.]